MHASALKHVGGAGQKDAKVKPNVWSKRLLPTVVTYSQRMQETKVGQPLKPLHAFLRPFVWCCWWMAVFDTVSHCPAPSKQKPYDKAYLSPSEQGLVK